MGNGANKKEFFHRYANVHYQNWIVNLTSKTYTSLLSSLSLPVNAQGTCFFDLSYNREVASTRFQENS